ncbi:dynein axonemal light chain 1 isoform 3-T3 [Syngnathus typhle]
MKCSGFLTRGRKFKCQALSRLLHSKVQMLSLPVGGSCSRSRLASSLSILSTSWLERRRQAASRPTATDSTRLPSSSYPPSSSRLHRLSELEKLLNNQRRTIHLTLGKATTIKEALTKWDAVGDTLEELWISYNLIEKMKGVHLLKKLKVLHMSNNLVKDWGEFSKLADLPCLVDLVFVGNPLEEKHSPDGTWTEEATKRLPRLTKLDGVPVVKGDVGEDDD